MDFITTARRILCESNSESEVERAVAKIYPCGPGGVGFAQRKSRDYLLALIHDIVRTENGHISFYRTGRAEY